MKLVFVIIVLENLVIALILAAVFAHSWRRKFNLQRPFSLIDAGDTPSIHLATPALFDPVRWTRLNPWLLEGQPDDRTPMIGSDGEISGSASARRSSARRFHQINYKAWSKERHN
jgi:hypothetical protein